MRAHIAVIAVALSFPAYAQNAPKCGPVAEIQKALKDKFNETLTSYGVVNERAVIEVYLSPDGKTWTILALGADGRACFLSAGKDWVSEQPATGKGT